VGRALWVVQGWTSCAGTARSGVLFPYLDPAQSLLVVAHRGWRLRSLFWGISWLVLSQGAGENGAAEQAVAAAAKGDRRENGPLGMQTLRLRGVGGTGAACLRDAQ